MLVCKGAIEQLQGNADPCPLDEEASINGQFVPGSPEVSGNLGNLLPVLGPTFGGEVIDGAKCQVAFHGALNDVQFSIR